MWNNEDHDEAVDALPRAQPLDCTPDFLKRVQSRVVQQRNKVGHVVVYAEQLDSTADATEQQERIGRLRKIVSAVAILFVSMMVVSLLVILLRKSSTAGEDVNLTGGGSSVQEDTNITENSIETIVALLRSYNVTENTDPSSSWSNEHSDPYRAVEWMSNNIALPHQLSPKTIVQYYALTTLHFALGGEGWLRNTNWLRPHSSVCGWYHVQCSGSDSVTGLDLGM
jgi:hypothetical protein